MLLLDASTTYLICNGSLLCTVDLVNIQEAVLALIGLFYLMDVDYPKAYELGLSILQNLCFGDHNMPGDILNVFNNAIGEYLKFKNSLY